MMNEYHNKGSAVFDHLAWSRECVHANECEAKRNIRMELWSLLLKSVQIELEFYRSLFQHHLPSLLVSV